MPTPTVRAATLGDAPALAEFLWSPGLFKSLEPLTPQALTQELEHKIEAAAPSSHTLLVATNEFRIVGYAAVHWLPVLFQGVPTATCPNGSCRLSGGGWARGC